jgi:hypothetical protein
MHDGGPRHVSLDGVVQRVKECVGHENYVIGQRVTAEAMRLPIYVLATAVESSATKGRGRKLISLPVWRIHRK